MARAEDGAHRGMRRRFFGDRREPARDPTVERVVVAALVVRLMRLALDARGRSREGREAPAPVATAVGHERVEAEVIPTRGERPPIAQPSAFQRGMHFRSPYKGEAVTADCVGDCSKEISHPQFPGSNPPYVVIPPAIPHRNRAARHRGSRVSWVGAGMIQFGINATHTARNNEHVLLAGFVSIRY